MNERGKYAICVAFVLLLLLPVLQMLTGAVSVTPLDENRAEHPLPRLDGLLHPASFVAALHDWFADHYGFRALLIRAKTQFDYSIFQSSDRLHIGRDGYLFYRSVIDQSEPAIERLSDADLDRAVQTFAQLRDYLAARGIHLVVMTAQLKDKFYPEMLPREARFARRRHRFDDFRAKLAALKGITYLDTTPMLAALKLQRPIFHRTDFHWNDPAAFVAAEQLTNTIAGLEHRPLPFWRHQLRISERLLSGGQARFMPLFRPPSEMALFVDPTWNVGAITWDPHAEPFEWRSTVTQTESGPPLPGLVIFGDSFTSGLVQSGLPRYFSSVYYARLYSVPLETVLTHLPADTKYFLAEFIEMSMPSWIDMKLPDGPLKSGEASATRSGADR